MEGTSYYCCYLKQLLSASLLLINVINTYANLLQHFIFAGFLLIQTRLWEVCTTKGDDYWLQF